MKGMFDIKKAIKNAHLSEKEGNRIKEEVRKEFPNDEMMYELHVIRAVNAYKMKHGIKV